MQSQRSSKIGRKIGFALRSAIELAGPEADVLFAATEQEALKIAVGELEKLEVRRRVAEARLSLFYCSQTSGDFARRAWEDLESMGFSSPEREASMLFYWADYLLNSGATNSEIRASIERFGTVVGAEFEGESAEVAEHFRAVHHRLQAKARGL